MEWSDGISIDIWGENTSPYHTMGILDAAKLKVNTASTGDE
jgi:hypothetical protein